MPDLNELLRWSIANSQLQSSDSTDSSSQQQQEQQLSLRFNPASASAPSGHAATLHSSDAGPPDLSPASTPGPGTPVGDNEIPLPPVAKREDLTTEMLDLILGKSDSIIMKEKIAFAQDESQSVEDRVEALDDFEMLVELIDNANNMPILKLWDPLLSLLSSPHPEIVAHSLWIMGTAVQNNLKAQAALYIHNVFPHILSVLYPSSSSSTTHPSSVRAKATYALSSALKHWPLASTVLSSSSPSGYLTIKRGVVDSDPVVRRKMAFLLGTLVMQSGAMYEGEIPNEVRNLLEERMKETQGQTTESLVDGLKREGVFEGLIDELKRSKNEDDVDLEFEENAIRALAQASEKGGLTDEQKKDLRSVWTAWGVKGQEERGLEGEDGKVISSALNA
ncbi:hypothetical protein CI109_102952 [Kwoniella shandongensis]|uniref:Uncharacterized protein n=1 Tax=Kwoniella shandongensis TaxID=1734106 RepID=A0A5M6C9P3_9TREE|nr:uncharacterized protein CI109_000140 [Kwoniella shandongensis]KAA5531300.1 hypothetical protein CI109_000140 [Kwoniella shandongensis]